MFVQMEVKEEPDTEMETERDNRCLISIGQKQVEVYPGAAPDLPVVYLNTFAGEGGQIREWLREAGCPDFTLVAISGLAWDHDMAPWDIPPISKDDTPCTGGADAYLQFLVEEVLPQAEKQIPGPVAWRGLAGYSLAGLFALYSAYQTGLFSRIACVSGSLWFPDLVQYVSSHTIREGVKHLYFSLGDRECHTRNRYLKPVQENTQSIASLCRKNGLDTVFELNPGNHFQNAVQRTAAGIRWILSRSCEIGRESS